MEKSDSAIKPPTEFMCRNHNLRTTPENIFCRMGSSGGPEARSGTWNRFRWGGGTGRTACFLEGRPLPCSPLLAAPCGPSAMCFLGTAPCLGCVVRDFGVAGEDWVRMGRAARGESGRRRSIALQHGFDGRCRAEDSLFWLQKLPKPTRAPGWCANKNPESTDGWRE